MGEDGRTTEEGCVGPGQKQSGMTLTGTKESLDPRSWPWRVFLRTCRKQGPASALTWGLTHRTVEKGNSSCCCCLSLWWLSLQETAWLPSTVKCIHSVWCSSPKDLPLGGLHLWSHSIDYLPGMGCHRSSALWDCFHQEVSEGGTTPPQALDAKHHSCPTFQWDH